MALRRIWFNLDPRNPRLSKSAHPLPPCQHEEVKKRHVLGFIDDQVHILRGGHPAALRPRNKQTSDSGLSRVRFPAALISAAQAGNVSAMGVMAQMHEVRACNQGNNHNL